MDHFDAARFLLVLAVIFGSAKLLGALARWIGQPAVLGELLAGVVVGKSMIGIVDPGNETLHLLAEIGLVLLLFEIGLETDISKLIQVGGLSTTVATVGVALPFALGYLVCRLLGLNNLVAVVAGATLTATSVGITARVLSDLDRLHEPESQIILGAAVLDDIIGLVILSVVGSLSQGEEVRVLGIATTAAIAFGFLAGTLLLGKRLLPPIIRASHLIDLPGTPTMFSVILAFSFAWLASAAGSALIIGAFAAGLLLRDAPRAQEVQRGIAQLGFFFVPIFFGLLIAAAVLGKFLAGYSAFWFKGDKRIIGVGMIPRGEVGLIFAQAGLTSGVFDDRLFSAATLMVMVTTFMAPPLLKRLCAHSRVRPDLARTEGVQELVNEP